MGFADELRNRTMTPQDVRRKEAEFARQKGYAAAEKEYLKIKKRCFGRLNTESMRCLLENGGSDIVIRCREYLI